MSKKSMIKELEAAGMTISEDAAIEEIETLYAELQVENAEKAAEPDVDAESETESIHINEVIDSGLAAHNRACPITPDPKMGDKDPAVIAWYRDNDRDEYERRYAGRTIPGV
jgi:hypothetical protein